MLPLAAGLQPAGPQGVAATPVAVPNDILWLLYLALSCARACASERAGEDTQIKPITLAEPQDFCMHTVQSESQKRDGLCLLESHF